MTDLLVLPEGVQPTVQEVETEFEDDEEEEQEHPDEVEEEESLGAEATLSPHADAGADYVLPEENKDVWKNFGYDTEAGRALRRLYAGTSQKSSASRVSYPRLISPARKWEPQEKPQRSCPQRAHVNVPGRARPSIDRDDPRYWRIPAPGRKPAEDILAEMEAHKPARPRLAPGRDQNNEKKGLQDKFRYAGGKMMPAGAMGNVEKGDVPDPVESRRARPERWDHVDESGLTKEQRDIFADITEAIAHKQKRLAEIDGQNSPGAKPSKDQTNRNKEALQLQNDIQGCLQDIDKLLEITD